MSDDDGVTRRNVVRALAGAAIGGMTGNYIINNEKDINRKGAEPNYIGKNTDMENIGIRNIDAEFYPQQKSGGDDASGLERVSKALDGISDDVLDNGILERGPSVLADVNPAPVDGGGQYQGNATNNGYTETNKNPVTGFGESNIIDAPNANIPPVSLNGRTAVAGNDSMEVYDQSGEEIASFSQGTESVPVFLNSGSEIVGADANGLFKFNTNTDDTNTGALLNKAPGTGSQGSIKVFDGTIAVESDDKVDFFNASDLEPTNTISNEGPTPRSLVFASADDVIYADGESVEAVNPETGEKRWTTEPFGNRVSNAGGATNGNVYVATDSGGRAHILDLEDGDKIKTLDIGQKPSASSPAFDADGNLYTATERIMKFNNNYEEKWRTPLDSRATVTSGIDNALIASTISSVQMLDKASGEIIDKALSGDAAKAAGMPKNGALPVITYGSNADEFLEIPIERNEPNQNEPASAYIDTLDLQGPKDAVPVGKTAQLDLNVTIKDNAPSPVRLTYELVVRHEGEQGILKDTTIGQPGATTTEEYPVTTESSEQDAVNTNGTAIDWDVNFEGSGSETARANATTTNSTFSS